MKALKQYLKQLDKSELKELFNKANLSELEYWVMIYGYIEKRMVINTCLKLNISRAYYFILKNKALIKLYFTINRH